MARQKDRVKLVTRGNMKLPNTTLIFNMSSALRCPADNLGLCGLGRNGNRSCYAMKGYRKCATHQAFYRDQEKYWKSCTAEEFVEMIRGVERRARIPVNALRLNECGEFHTQACVDKAEAIATALRDTITTYVYTHRSDLNFRKCKNLVVNASEEPDRLWGASQGLNCFRVVAKATKQYPTCPGDCRKCSRCLKKTGRVTQVLRH